jgi:flagella basal body P-ring formation protein FlgA
MGVAAGLLVALVGVKLAVGDAAAAGSDESPLVATARAKLLDQLQHARPDIRRFELTVLGHPTGRASTDQGSAVVSGTATLGARKCIWVRLGPSAGSVPVWFAVQAFRPVLVSQTRRVVRSSLNPEDVSVDERDVAMLSGVPLDVDTDLHQMRVRRAISTGRILLKADVEPIPPILRGQEVAVEVRYGSVDIETHAVALREAQFGEAVMLQNPESHLTYAARVVGQGRAMVVDQ